MTPPYKQAATLVMDKETAFEIACDYIKNFESLDEPDKYERLEELEKILILLGKTIHL